MRATRNDNVDTLNGALCRAEMLEAIVRLSEKLALYEYKIRPRHKEEQDGADSITESDHSDKDKKEDEDSD